MGKYIDQLGIKSHALHIHRLNFGFTSLIFLTCIDFDRWFSNDSVVISSRIKQKRSNYEMLRYIKLTIFAHITCVKMFRLGYVYRIEQKLSFSKATKLTRIKQSVNFLRNNLILSLKISTEMQIPG
jgi:hypothetical protein